MPSRPIPRSNYSGACRLWTNSSSRNQETMSKYANYSAISKEYDSSRSAVASHLYVGQFLTSLQKPLEDVHLLDAGCGTGNYALAMLESGVGRISLIDASEGMLEKAREKLGPLVKNSNVDIKQHCLPTVPYSDETFDAVMINNVLHHLDTEPHFPNVLATFKEARRVLKKGGLLINQIMFPHQALKGIWFYHLAPKALDAFLKRFIGLAEYKAALHHAGFSDFEIVVPTSTLSYSRSVYFNADGPMDPVVRKCDSFYDEIGPKGLEEIEAMVRELKEKDGMDAFISEKDKSREEVGQISLVFARKSPNY